jgi:Peptidase family M1 domain
MPRLLRFLLSLFPAAIVCMPQRRYSVHAGGLSQNAGEAAGKSSGRGQGHRRHRISSWAFGVPLLLAVSASGQVSAINSPGGKPLSDRVVAYWIDSKLNTDAKTLDATEILEYRNDSDQPLSTFPFHLYLNAFRPQSTFSAESRRDDSGLSYASGEQGAIDISSISAEGYGDLAQSMHFTAPDDGNREDHTVMEVTLPKPLAPGEAVRFHLAFHDKFPLSVARNGYKRDFIMGGQWFPKIGIWWHGEWNCHQYHADTEFFSDFGTYNVNLTLPHRYVVGASGIQTGEQPNSDGTKTLSFRGEDIHDFAWAASPHFEVADDTFTNSLGTVKLHALVLASHADQRERYLSVLKQSMQKFDEWYGPYPYKQITLIDPEPNSEMGGMEYPTLITGGTTWWEPSWLNYIMEATVSHEFGHQYWYGMVGTNEFEEPWLDEGINTYSETQVMGSLFGQNTSALNARTLYTSDAGLERVSYLHHPDEDPVARHAWQFASDSSYGSIVYGKTSTALTTLETVLGEGTLRQALRVYFTRYRFKHPTATDFLHTVEEVSGRSDLQPYFAQAIYGTEILDYSVDSLTSGPSEWWKGKDAGGQYHTSVLVRRKGGFVFPVKLEVGFEDGSKEQATWDGKDRWMRFSWDKASRAVYAQVDPDGVVKLDANSFNNSYTLQPSRTARLKLTNYWVVAQQILAQWLSFLV